MTAPARFRTTRRFLAPRWLTEGEGGLVGYSLDLLKDGFIERLRLGLLARLPQNSPDGSLTAPPDALAAMGRDRRVVRGINESDPSYARRLVPWLDDRKTAGNSFALMQKLAEYTGPLPSFRTVDARGNWFSRAADGTTSYLLNQGNWNWDGDTDPRRWSRLWVIIYPNGLWTQTHTWGESGLKWGAPGVTYGSTATTDEVQTVRAIAADWMGGGKRLVNIIVAFDPASFNPTSPEPDGYWGRPYRSIAGVATPTRLTTAAYWDGV